MCATASLYLFIESAIDSLSIHHVWARQVQLIGVIHMPCDPGIQRKPWRARATLKLSDRSPWAESQPPVRGIAERLLIWGQRGEEKIKPTNRIKSIFIWLTGFSLRKTKFEYNLRFYKPKPTQSPRRHDLNPGCEVCWVVMTDRGVTSCVVCLLSTVVGVILKRRKWQPVNKTYTLSQLDNML